jgi:hypothetical protein
MSNVFDKKESWGRGKGKTSRIRPGGDGQTGLRKVGARKEDAG